MIVDSYVKDICKEIKGKRVLDIGCCASTPKNLLKRHNMYKQAAKEIVGIDINKDLLKLAKERGAENLFYLDITDTYGAELFAQQYKPFNTIICTDVIEHISNSGFFLENLKKCMTDDGKIYLTTPNASSVRWMTMLLKNKLKINADHVCWYDRFTLGVLMKRHGLKITKTMYHSSEKHDAVFLNMDHQEWMARRLYVIIEKE